MIYGLPNNDRKEENVFSYFHSGPFGTDLQVTQRKFSQLIILNHSKNPITILKLKVILRAVISNKTNTLIKSKKHQDNMSV